MKIDKCKKASFVVIGKEGSTSDGEGFIQKLWDDANSHFGEVQHLAKKDETEISVGYGARCPISLIPSSLGKISIKGFILWE